MARVSDQTPRPSHTTMAAGMVIVGSVLVVLTVVQQLSALSSLDTREAVQDFLSEPPGSTLGLATADALSLLRTAMMVVAGCATAAGILGYHALQRSHRARLGLAVLAVPLFLGGLATGGFLTSLVAVASMLLWIGPSGAWFRGETYEPPARRTPWDRPAATPPERPTGTPDLGRPSGPDAGWPPPPGPDPASGRPAPPPPYPTPLGTAGPTTRSPAAPARRPDPVLWACVLTWAFTGITVAVAAATFALVAVDPDLIWEQLQEQDPQLAARSGLGRDALVEATYVTLGFATVWSLVAMALALMTLRRSAVGRIGLLISASIAAVVCLAGAWGSVVLLVPLAGCVTTIVLLARPEVARWFASPPPHP